MLKLYVFFFLNQECLDSKYLKHFSDEVFNHLSILIYSILLSHQIYLYSRRFTILVLLDSKVSHCFLKLYKTSQMKMIRIKIVEFFHSGDLLRVFGMVFMDILQNFDSHLVKTKILAISILHVLGEISFA